MSTMYRTLMLILCLAAVWTAAALAEENGPPAPGATGEPVARMRGMSVLGNNEAPMSLFIVPWKSSELGIETNLTRTLNERDVPVDREVFMRELDYYQVSTASSTSAPGAGTAVLKSR